MNKNIFQNWTATKELDTANTISNENDYIIGGNNFTIDGNNVVYITNHYSIGELIRFFLK